MKKILCCQSSIVLDCVTTFTQQIRDFQILYAKPFTIIFTCFTFDAKRKQYNLLQVILWARLEQFVWDLSHITSPVYCSLQLCPGSFFSSIKKFSDQACLGYYPINAVQICNLRLSIVPQKLFSLLFVKTQVQTA